jgi:hypothetical protein
MPATPIGRLQEAQVHPDATNKGTASSFSWIRIVKGSHWIENKDGSSGGLITVLVKRMTGLIPPPARWISFSN